MKDTTKTYKHDAFGIIGISRVTSGGKGQVLFGSKIRHSLHFELKIYPGSVDRNLSRHWFHADHGPIITVKLTPIQLIELIATMNVGDGIPCTIKQVLGETLPELTLDDVGSERDNVQDELKETIAAALQCAKDIQRDLAALKTKSSVSKKDIASLSGKADAIVREMEANIPFIRNQFEESMEQTIGEMAATVDAMFTDVVTKLGLDALQERYGALESAIDIQPTLMIDSNN